MKQSKKDRDTGCQHTEYAAQCSEQVQDEAPLNKLSIYLRRERDIVAKRPRPRSHGLCDWKEM